MPIQFQRSQISYKIEHSTQPNSKRVEQKPREIRIDRQSQHNPTEINGQNKRSDQQILQSRFCWPEEQIEHNNQGQQHILPHFNKLQMMYIDLYC